MFCSKCGSKNAEDTLFCGQYGVPLEATQSGPETQPEQQQPAPEQRVQTQSEPSAQKSVVSSYEA